MQNSNPFVKVTISHYGRRSLHTEEGLKNEINEEEVDVSDCISSDFGAEVTYSRDDLSGVVVETSLPQKFTKKAYELLRSLFEKHGVYACGKLHIYRRDSIDVSRYHHLKNMELDFSSISINNRSKYIEIECTTTSIHSYIKANEKTKYDMFVIDVDKTTFNYERIELVHTVDFNPFLPSEVRVESTKYLYNILPVSLGKYLGISSSNAVELKSCEEKSGGEDILNQAGPYFMKVKKDLEITIDLNFTVRIYNSSIEKLGGLLHSTLYLAKRSFQDDEAQLNATSTTLAWRTHTNGTCVFMGNGSFKLKKGDELFFYIRVVVDLYNGSLKGSVQPEMVEFNKCQFSYQDIGSPINLNIASPENMLHELVQKMTNGDTQYKTKIEWGGDEKSNYAPMLCAAESIRNLDKPNFHTSYSDFKDWMATLGYMPHYPDDFSLEFKKLDTFFPNEVVLHLDEKENTDLIINADSDFLYTHIKVGYEKQEYGENVNGRFEPNGTFEYSTGYISEEENILEIMSKYRADPVGIELLTWERPEHGAKNKDTKSDNDVFVFALKKENNVYSLFKGAVMQVENITLFNAFLNPYFIVQNNLKRIGIITKKLLFSSTTSNREADFNNIHSMFSDIKCEDSYFKPVTYNIACGNKTSLPIIESPNGLVEFVNNGHIYTGYIKEATKNYSRDTETTIVLYARH